MSGYLERHYKKFALAILALALFNLTFRLGSEFVSEWDESLYAISAWEAITHGSWIGTTFLGQLDYYNTKPPLMVWLIALNFKAFGVNLVSLRLTSALCSWATVAVLQRWTKRCFGPLVSLFSSLVLATTFGFAHVHAGRSAATDAPFTLVLLLVVVTLWAERERPWRRLWLGPLLAAAFMLRGMGMLMPLALVAAVTLLTLDRKRSWMPTLAAAGLFAAPVGAWLIARYQVDGWSFLEPLFMYDFIARTVQPIEGHPGGWLFYLDVLQKDQYDWLLAMAAASALFPWRASLWRTVREGWSAANSLWPLLAMWAAVTLLIPTVMQTKLPWYLNTFFPLFALLVALSVSRGLSAPAGWRSTAVVCTCVLAFGVAEGKLLYYSWHHRDLGLSEQSLLLDERIPLGGHHVYMEHGTRADHFVVEALIGATPAHTADAASFLRDSEEGDYLLAAEPCDALTLESVRSNRNQFLCRHPWQEVPPDLVLNSLYQ